MTPLLRSWQVVVIVAVFFGRDLIDAITFGGDADDSLTTDVVEQGPLAALVGFTLLALLTVAGVISWRCTRYRLGSDTLEFERGVLARQHRRAPLDRLQAVDIVRPLTARLFGLATVTLEVAGGSDSRIEVAYLSDDEAHALRRQLLSVSGQVLGSEGALHDGPSEAGVPIIEVTVARLVGSILLSGAAIFVAIATPVTIAAIAFTQMWGMIAVLVSTLLAAGASAWKQFTTGYGFRATMSSRGLQLRHGLLEQRTQTVPDDRIQAVRLHQPVLWRVVDWWRVEVNVAGYGAPTGDDPRPSSVVMPVGSIHGAMAVLGCILPTLAVDDAALRGAGDAGGFTSSPRRARWVDPIGWHRNGFRADPEALLLRRGRLQRTLDVVPHARTQSIGSFQGPLQRRLGLAGFEVHSTPGPVHPSLANLASDVAARLVEDQSRRARSARRADGL